MTAERLPALDGLRGLAILAVLLLHFTVYGGPPPAGGIDGLFYRAAQAGWIGVDLFFVLSGFLITGILYDAKGSATYFRSFYARRVLRIFPLYYGALAVFLLLVPALRRDAFWYWTYLSNIQIAREGWPDSGALGHFWSLAVEEQFYLVWPVVVLLLGRRSLMAACWACLAGSLLLRVGLHLMDQETAAFVLTPARLDSLAAGALLALAARGPEGLAPVARRTGAMAGACAIALLAVASWRGGLPAEDSVVGTVGHTLLAGLFASILALAAAASPGAFLIRGLSSPFLVFFGRYSYGLYVIHHPLLFLKPESLSATASLPSRLLFILLATVVSVALAWVSWHLWEKRFLQLKHLFPYRAAPAERVALGAPQ